MRHAMDGSLKFEAEFFRKSNNLTVARERKIRSIQMRSVHLLLLLALVLLTGLLVSRVADFLFRCDALQVRAFRLRHQPVFARDQVGAILRRFGGSILALDLKEMQSRLLQVPEVAQASIRRVLPDTVEIDFTLRRPFFQQLQGGAFRLLDAEGVELGRVRECPAGLVPLRGDSPALVAAIAPFSRELRPLRGRIEYVGHDEARGVELKLRAAPETFYPGESGFAAKIGRYFRIKERLALDAAAIRRVDLRIPGRIYIEFEEQQRGKP